MRNAAASGISAEEMHVLVGNYYWKRDLSAPSYTSAQPDMLLRASANPTLDGERAEAQTSRLAVALACVGDEKFAEALSRQSDRVKHMVAFFISTLWTRFDLRYPRTGPFSKNTLSQLRESIAASQGKMRKAYDRGDGITSMRDSCANLSVGSCAQRE
ncbi:MAG TPA: hypothetical protein VFU09_01535 [Candidatus Udaeobacter sp.]|nr:hypothetical protein [Candidatus Udaeobacter sp.]